MRNKILIYLVVSAVVTGLTPTITSAYYQVIDLGTLDGYPYSIARSVNNKGQIVGSAYYDGYSQRACLFDPTGGGANINLVPSGGWNNWATSINDNGQIVGNADWVACLFDPTGGGANINLGTCYGYPFSFANSINNNGQIVGNSWNWNSDCRACLFDPTGGGANIYLGGLVGVGDYSSADSINDRGQIVGCAQDSPGTINCRHACLFDPTGGGANIDLGILSGYSFGGASSINNNGQIVGYAWDSSWNSRACLFDPTGGGANIDLGNLGGNWSSALSINDSGQIVGAAGDTSTGDYRPCLFDSTGQGNNIDLNTLIDPSSGWTLVNAYSINNNGWIVGDGINPEGYQHAFLLIPELPVANAGPDQTVYAWIDGTADVNLDGSASYDVDNQPLTYLWNWTIDGNTYDTNGVKPTIELPVGQYVIQLIVNDGIDDSEPNEVVITVVPPVEAHLSIEPKVLNCRSHQPRIMAAMHLPIGITKDHVDINQPLLLYPGEIEAVQMRISQGSDECRVLRTTIFAWFDKNELMSVIPDNGRIELAVVGRLKTGQYFFGSDNITVICPGNWPWHRPWHHYRWNRWCQRPFNFRH